LKLRYTPPAASGGSATAYTLSGVKVTRFNVENLYEGDGFNRTGRKQTIDAFLVKFQYLEHPQVSA